LCLEAEATVAAAGTCTDVFAIAQHSHHLLEHVDLRTGAETLILALAFFYGWYMTAWG
jgi:low temperature requirement protein LtrA